MSAIYFST